MSAFEHPYIIDLGSMFQEAADLSTLNLSYHDMHGGAAVVLLSKVVPKDARVLFDGGGQGFPILPFQIIQFPFKRSIEVKMRYATVENTGGTYDRDSNILDDLRFRFLVFPQIEMVVEQNPAAFVQSFRLSKVQDGQLTIQNMLFPALTSIFSSTQEYGGVIGIGNANTWAEGQHIWRNLNSADPEKFIVNYPFDLARLQVYGGLTGSQSVTWQGVIK